MKKFLVLTDGGWCPYPVGAGNTFVSSLEVSEMVRGIAEHAEIIFCADDKHRPFCPSWAKFHDFTQDPPEHDAVILYAKVAQFFGGAVQGGTVQAHKFMALTDKPIFQLGYDNSIAFLDLPTALEKRTRSGGKKYAPELLDSMRITAPKHLIAQQRFPEDAAKYMREFYSLPSYELDTVGQFPLEGWAWNPAKFLRPMRNPRYDLQYIGSSFNGQERILPFLRYYTGLPSDITLSVRGHLNMDEALKVAKEIHKKRGGRGDLPVIPQCGEGVISRMMNSTNNEALAQVAIAVRHNKKVGNVPLRISELAMGGCVAFFDNLTAHIEGQDPFLIVNNQYEMLERLRELKGNYPKRVFFVERERERLDAMYSNYGTKLFNHISARLENSNAS